MNKGQLIESVAAELGEPKAKASRAVEAVIRCLADGIRSDASVTIGGFGTFSRKQRAARNGRNPATGEPLRIEASTTVNFKPSQSLKDSIS